ncbi:MAG: DUF4112 domain-containing protein [Planctomycetota bacterium]
MNDRRDAQLQLQQIRDLARWLDTSFRVPGTRFRFGLDALIGLVPVGGDVATAVAGLLLIQKASQLGASRLVIARMLINFLIDLGLGAIPIAGDVFDFVWRSNHRNVKLLESYLAKPGSSLPAAQVIHGIRRS